MECQDCDPRINCPNPLPSTCVPYTGKVSSLIKNFVPCSPNINDIIEQIQKLIEDVKRSLGDNKTLVKNCFEFNNTIVTQVELNQLLLDKCCILQTELDNVGDDLSITALQVTMDINLLCIESELCDPLTTYTLDAIIRKMVLKFCELETRVKAIEDFLGL